MRASGFTSNRLKGLRQTLRGMAARVRRAPKWVMLPERALRAEIDRCEREGLRLAKAGRSSGAAFGRLVKAWVAVERLYWDVREWNARVRFKRVVLADAGLRAELRDALGGDAAMARWEAAWESEERDEGSPECGREPHDKAEAMDPSYRWDERGGGGSSECPPRERCGAARDKSELECVRDGLHGELRARFRLARRPRGAGATEGSSSPRPLKRERRTRRQARGFRIPVWPEELKAAERDESVVRPHGRGMDGFSGFAKREPVGRPELSRGVSVVAVACRSP